MSGTTGTCLVVEDEALIAMHLEMTLEERGISVAGPFSTEADALSRLEQLAPDVAIIDVKLGEGECTALLRELGRRGIPFVVHSGLGPQRRASAEYSGLTWIDKPADHTTIISTLERIAPGLTLLKSKAMDQDV